MRRMYWATAVLGVLLIIAPAVLGYTSNRNALIADVGLGVLILLFSAIRAIMYSRNDSLWEFWLIGLFGIAAIVAPSVLSFTSVSAAAGASEILGVLTLIAAAARILAAPMLAEQRRRQEEHN